MYSPKTRVKHCPEHVPICVARNLVFGMKGEFGKWISTLIGAAQLIPQIGHPFISIIRPDRNALVSGNSPEK